MILLTSSSIISRKCTVCGKELEIKLYENGQYSGAHYFGIMELPVGEGENKKVGTMDLNGLKADVVQWTGDHEEIEYWECDDCYHED